MKYKWNQSWHHWATCAVFPFALMRSPQTGRALLSRTLNKWVHRGSLWTTAQVQGSWSLLLKPSQKDWVSPGTPGFLLFLCVMDTFFFPAASLIWKWSTNTDVSDDMNEASSLFRSRDSMDVITSTCGYLRLHVTLLQEGLLLVFWEG